MLGVTHFNSKTITTRSRTALTLGLCATALAVSAGAASASGSAAPLTQARNMPDAMPACERAVTVLPPFAADEALAMCKLVNGWD